MTVGEGAIVGLSMTPQRQEIFDFSEPLHFNELQLVVRKGSEFPFNRLADLKGRNIGGGSGVSYGPEVDGAIATGVFVMVSDTDASARLQKVLLGTLDAAIIGHGMPGLDVPGWGALYGPAHMPQPLIDQINKATRAALARPEARERLEALSMEPMGSDANTHKLRLAADYKRMGDLVRKSGLTLE